MFKIIEEKLNCSLALHSNPEGQRLTWSPHRCHSPLCCWWRWSWPRCCCRPAGSPPPPSDSPPPGPRQTAPGHRGDRQASAFSTTTTPPIKDLRTQRELGLRWSRPAGSSRPPRAPWHRWGPEAGSRPLRWSCPDGAPSRRVGAPRRASGQGVRSCGTSACGIAQWPAAGGKGVEGFSMSTTSRVANTIGPFSTFELSCSLKSQLHMDPDT